MVSEIKAARLLATMLLSCLLAASAQTQPPASTPGEPLPNGVFKVGGDVTAPRAIYRPYPEYSEEARKAHRQGTCVLSLVVGTEGKPHDIKVVRALGMGLDERAVDAVSAWKFEPALKNGKPVPVLVHVEVSFHSAPGPQTQLLIDELQRHQPPRLNPTTTVQPCQPVFPADHERPSNPAIEIADLTFEGVHEMSPEVQSEIAESLKQHFFKGGIDGATSEALEMIRVAWQNLGYFKVHADGDARILTSSPSSERIALRVHIDEGQQYRLGHISFENNNAISNVKVLRTLFPISDGDIFDRGKIATGLEKLRQAYLEHGYINFTPFPDTRIDDDKLLIDLNVEVDEGRQFFISRIEMVGRGDRSLSTASQELALKVGDVYNERLAKMFQERYDAPLTPFIEDERAGTIGLVFDLRHCPRQ